MPTGEGSRQGRTLALRALDAVPGPVARTVRRNRVLSAALRPFVNRLVTPEPAAVTVRGGPAAGLKIVVDPTEEKFYWAGVHEEHVQSALVSRLAPGQVFWDVGAHIGFFSFLAGRLVGDSGEVVAFEPMPANRDRLLTARELNHAANVRVEPVALGHESGAALLREHRQSTMWSIAERGSGGAGIEVERRTLDEAASHGRPPDLIKIDVEGAELDVLRGGLELLGSRRVPVIVEFHDEEALEQGRRLLPGREFRHLEHWQWLLA
jgi:FkbM family methyltransferase